MWRGSQYCIAMRHRAGSPALSWSPDGDKGHTSPSGLSFPGGAAEVESGNPRPRAYRHSPWAEEERALRTKTSGVKLIFTLRGLTGQKVSAKVDLGCPYTRCAHIATFTAEVLGPRFKFCCHTVRHYWSKRGPQLQCFMPPGRGRTSTLGSVKRSTARPHRRCRKEHQVASFFMGHRA